MVTLQGLFLEILTDGYDSHREPIEIAFSEVADHEATGEIGDFSIRYIDGMQRGLCVLAILRYLIQQACAWSSSQRWPYCMFMLASLHARISHAAWLQWAYCTTLLAAVRTRVCVCVCVLSSPARALCNRLALLAAVLRKRA